MKPNTKTPEAPSDGVPSTFAGLPLFDTVKHRLFLYWCEANHYLYLIDRHRVQVEQAKDFGGYEYSFRAKVIQLYRAVRAKLGYHEGSDTVRAIQSLKPDLFLAKPHLVKLSDAIELFTYLTEFLEIDGITRFEMRQADVNHALMEELEAKEA